MVLAHQYRILGLRTGASFSDIKLAYRHLARLYHPDTNPGNNQAKEKFIQVTQAYQALSQALPQAAARVRGQRSPVNPAKPNGHKGDQPSPANPVQEQARTSPQVRPNSSTDQDLKQMGFNQLQGLFRSRRYARAIALVEGLAHRFPQDPEVRQWQAITYYRWGQASISSGDFIKAAACLRKARRVDPHNRSLHQALDREFHRLQQLTSNSEVQASIG
ncbi:MAG: J domain-containing protein [Nodosilinea sp. LVE1205-7]